MMPSFDRSVRFLACSLLLMFALFQAACEPSPHAVGKAYISREDDRWLQRVIPVCFEQARAYEKDRAIIQQSVSAEFARADIYFEGWDTCRPEDQGLRIRFDENADMSQTHDIGRKNAGIAANLIIGFKSRCGGVFSGSVCESNIALHEFGHALGLRHEMNRRDNQSCVLDQMAGEGEDALQLGPYDARSIMDYCFLYAANDKLEALRLSDQDVAALKTLNSGLVASLDRLVPMVLQEPWMAYVKGSDLTGYRYALGPKNQLACDQGSSYSQSLSLNQPILINPLDLHSDPATVWTLCLLGENAAGQQQDLKAYSAIDFRIVKSTEVFSGPTAPTLMRQPFLYRQDQEIILEIAMEPGLPLRSLAASLVYTQSSVYKRITNARFKSRNIGDGRYQLVFRPEDFPSNGEVYVSTLELTDILGRRLSLFSAEAWTSFFGQIWYSPALTVDWSYQNDEAGPALLQIQSFPQEVEAGGKASFVMEINENSRLQQLRLVLRSMHGSLEPALTWQRLHDQFYRVDMEIPPQAVNGSYEWESLSLEDIMNNRSSYSLDPASHTIQGTAIPLSTVIIKGGLSYESHPPQLQGLRFSSDQIRRNEKAFVELDIFDESTIKQVQLRLRHKTDQSFYRTIYGIDLGEIAGKRRIELNITKDHPAGAYEVQEITIVDRFGHSSRYESDSRNPLGTVELLHQ